MTEPAAPTPSPSPKQKPARRRGWGRRILRGFLILLVLVAIFHRPLFHTGARLALRWVAARQNLTLDVQFSGTIFTNLTVQNVRALPTGKGPTPVARIQIERVRLEYSLPRLVKGGIGEFLQSYEIKNADLIFIAKESKSEAEKKQKRTLAQDLNNILAQPAAYADRVSVENFNLIIRTTGEDTEIRGLDLQLHPVQPGYLRIASLQAPGVPDWQNLSAQTSYARRNLFIQELQLGPDIVFDEINFDASRRAQNQGSMQIRARLFGGTLGLSLTGTQLRKKGKNLAKSYDTTLTVSAAGLRIEDAMAYFEMTKPLAAKLDRLDLVCTGEPEKPQTWRGHMNSRVEALAFGKAKVDSVTVNAVFQNGRAEVTTGQITLGQNSVELPAVIGLPESVNEFDRSEVEATLKVAAPDLTALTATLPDTLRGHATGEGKVTMRDRLLSAEVTLMANDVQNKDVDVGAAKLRLEATKRFDPAASRMIENLTSKVTAELDRIRFQTFMADAVRIDGETLNDLVTLRRLEIIRAENSVTAQGTYRLPRDPKVASVLPVDGQFTIKAPKLEAFGLDVAGKRLSGRLDANGRLNVVNDAYEGGAQIEGGDLQVGDFVAERLAGRIEVAKSIADIQQLELEIKGADRITATGKASLVGPWEYHGALDANVADLAALQPLLEVFGQRDALDGALQITWKGNGTIDPENHDGILRVASRKGKYGEHSVDDLNLAGSYALRNRRASTDLTLTAADVASNNLGVTSANLHLTATKRLDLPGRAPFDHLESNLTGDVSGLKVETFTIDKATLDAATTGDSLTLRRFTVARGENSISVEGTYQLPHDAGSAPSLPGNAKFSVAAPKLEAFGIALGGQTLSGRLQATGDLELVNNAYNGAVRIDGGDFKVGGFVAEQLTAKIEVANSIAEIEDFALRIDDNNGLSLRGNTGLVKPFAYDAAMLVQIKNLARFEPLLAAFNIKEQIRGALQVDWSGKGQVEAASHSGELSVDLSKGRYGDVDLREIKLEGIYGADFAESSVLRIVSDQTSFDAILEFRDGKIKLRDINLQQAQLPVLTGYLILPFEPANTEQRFPLDKRIAANLNANKLDIARLLSSLRIKSPVEGIVTANLVAGGTLLQPFTHLKVTGRSLTTKTAPKLAPADLDLVMHYSRKEVTLDATVKQPQMQPLTIKGRAPLDLEATVTNQRIDPELPVDLTVRLPPSSLAVVAALVPAVRRVEGSAAIDARVGGTVGKPVLSGEASIQINSARLANESVPAIGAFRASLALAKDTLSFRTFRGEIGGGSFDLSGQVQLKKLTEPFFDLRLQSRDVLVRRDDTITVRVDTDVRIDGPLTAGTVSGNIFVVNSRFFREIDILPIGLPGRPKPKPKSAPSKGAPSFDTPPLRDWKFDVTIKTRPNDPFRIRGNLANGGAAIDLKFGGTGLKPWLDGNVRVENFVASLPFSKLSVSRGFITFKPDAPFEPSLDLQAESTLRDYHISAYIYGKTSDPQVSLTSEPPLPQQDIVSLLATGTTTSELTGSSNVIAGRAAVLVFQQLYRKVFKKREPAEGDDLLDRFDFDVGAVDNRTGQQEISAGFKLSERVYLIGDLDVAGEFTGRVRYLLRFR